MAMLMKSSELEFGSEGRAMALRFRDRAQECLELACRSQTFDYTLAEAALVRTLGCSGDGVLISGFVVPQPPRSWLSSNRLATLFTPRTRRRMPCRFLT